MVDESWMKEARAILACLRDEEERDDFIGWAGEHKELYKLNPQIALMIYMIERAPCPMCRATNRLDTSVTH